MLHAYNCTMSDVTPYRFTCYLEDTPDYRLTFSLKMVPRQRYWLPTRITRRGRRKWMMRIELHLNRLSSGKRVNVIEMLNGSMRYWKCDGAKFNREGPTGKTSILLGGYRSHAYSFSEKITGDQFDHCTVIRFYSVIVSQSSHHIRIFRRERYRKQNRLSSSLIQWVSAANLRSYVSLLIQGWILMLKSRNRDGPWYRSK